MGRRPCPQIQSLQCCPGSWRSQESHEYSLSLGFLIHNFEGLKSEFAYVQDHLENLIKAIYSYVVGYFDHTLTFPRLIVKFTMNQRAELATSYPESTIEALEDPGHIEIHRK